MESRDFDVLQPVRARYRIIAAMINAAFFIIDITSSTVYDTADINIPLIRDQCLGRFSVHFFVKQNQLSSWSVIKAITPKEIIYFFLIVNVISSGRFILLMPGKAISLRFQIIHKIQGSRRKIPCLRDLDPGHRGGSVPWRVIKTDIGC